MARTSGARKTPAEKAATAALSAYLAADPDFAALSKEWKDSCKKNHWLAVMGNATTPAEKKAAAAHEALRVRFLTAQAKAMRNILQEVAQQHNLAITNSGVKEPEQHA